MPLCITWLSRDSACLLVTFLESDAHEILMWGQPDLQEAKESRMVAEAMNIAKTAYVGISCISRSLAVMHSHALVDHCRVLGSENTASCHIFELATMKRFPRHVRQTDWLVEMCLLSISILFGISAPFGQIEFPKQEEQNHSRRFTTLGSQNGSSLANSTQVVLWKTIKKVSWRRSGNYAQLMFRDHWKRRCTRKNRHHLNRKHNMG